MSDSISGLLYRLELMSGTVPESKNIGSSRNPSAIILLNKHNIKPIPNNLLYSDGI